VALNQIECPECGARLKSPEGFTPGESVDCPKCESSFTVRASNYDAAVDGESPKKRRRGDDEVEKGYKNSPMRYAVLGVLVAVMIVLGVLLVQKKQRDREIEEENAKINAKENGGPDQQAPILPPPVIGKGVVIGGGPVGPPPVGPPPLPPPPPLPGQKGPNITVPKKNPPIPGGGPTGGNGVFAETPFNGTPEFNSLMTKLRQQLAGSWQGAAPDGTVHRVTYKADGQFTLDVGGKTTSGTWQAVGLVGGKVLKISRGTPTAYKVVFEGDELIHDTDTAGVSLVMKKK
jgi:hypothetical protein